MTPELEQKLNACKALPTPPGVAARIVVAARPVIESVGGRLLGGGFTFGKHDGAFMMEAPDDESAVAVSLAVTAGGAVSPRKPGPQCNQRSLRGHYHAGSLASNLLKAIVLIQETG